MKKIGFAPDALARLGIRFETSKEVNAFSDIITEEYEVRIGSEISRRCNAEQLAELDRIIESKGDSVKWFNRNVPEYLDIIYKKYTELAKELLDYIDEIPGVIKPAKKGRC